MIEAYCRRQSYAPGESVELCISSNAQSLSYQVHRMGALPKLVADGRCACAEYAIPPDVVANGCDWPIGLAFLISRNWQSGFYIITLTAENGEKSEAFFVLRATQPRSTILWVIETNTWNAYNTFGGSSTYTVDGVSYSAGAPVVSFDRPLAKGFITLPENPVRLAATIPGVPTPFTAWVAENGLSRFCGSASWSQWGSKFAAWLENEDIAVDYAVSGDLQEFPQLLKDYRLVLSVGHDEYWSWEMRDAIETHIARGGNVAFFSGNVAFWQVRLDLVRRQMVAYKADVANDPVLKTEHHRHNSGLWSYRETQRPENQMTGVSFTRGGYARLAGATPASAGGYTIYRADHWALEGTGLRYGDQLGAEFTVVGYECDGCALRFENGLPFPTGEDGTPSNFEIIGIAPAALFTRENTWPGRYPDGVLSDLELVALQVGGDLQPDTLARFAHGHAVTGTYTSAANGTVFTAGTTDWVYGLEDAQVSRITRNIIRRLS